MENYIHLLSQSIREKRQAKGLTKTELGLQLGYTASSIVTEWEKGNKVPTTDALVKMSNLFGCSVDELIFGSQSRYVEADRDEIDEWKNKYLKSLEELNELQKKHTKLVEDMKESLKIRDKEKSGLLEDLRKFVKGK